MKKRTNLLDQIRALTRAIFTRKQNGLGSKKLKQTLNRKIVRMRELSLANYENHKSMPRCVGTKLRRKLLRRKAGLGHKCYV
ncbi:MAG TPA: hypothetical protein PLZ43_12430 [bacterium]|nr:hypothetical protein [bacterium]